LLQRRDAFSIYYLAAAPVVVRVRDLNWTYELEVAPVTQLEPRGLRLSWGGRLGAGVGIGALRTRDFLPWGGLVVAAEHFFEGPRAGSQALRAGVRFGFAWLP
jgi:hypothetical protein